MHYITILKWQEDNGDTTWGAMCESLSYYVTAESRSRLVGLIDEWLAWPENAQKRIGYRSESANSGSSSESVFDGERAMVPPLRFSALLVDQDG